MNTDVVIIGSGISGLTAAALLAQKGKRVIILEKKSRPGGALKRFKRQGIPFDVGFHYTGGLGKGEILRVLWEHLNILPGLSIQPFPPHGNDQVSIKDSDKTVRCFFSYELLQKELQRVFPHEKHGINEYMDTIRSICSTIPFFNLDLPLTPFLRNLFGPANTNLADALKTLTKDQELQTILNTPAFLHGVPPENVSLATHAIVAHSYYSGAYALDGGGQAIVDAFVSELNKAGVHIKTSCAAQEIMVHNSRVSGVRSSNEEIHAADVIFTGHPTHLLDIINGQVFRPVYCNRLRELKNTGSMFIVFGAVDDPDSLQETTWVNYYSVQKGMGLLAVHPESPENSSMMLTTPGRRDSDAISTNSARGVILMRPADWCETADFQKSETGKRPAAYEDWKSDQTEKLLGQAHKLWGGTIGEIKPLAAGSPLTLRDELGNPQGGVYGVKHSLGQFITGARTRLPGLWLSGQGTLMTGIMGASLSGFVTAGEMLGLEELWDEVRQCR